MTEKDRLLIQQAERLIDDDDVDALRRQADTEECRQRLTQIMIRLYHREEAGCGCI